MHDRSISDELHLLDDLRDGIDVHLAPLTVEQYQQMIREMAILAE